MHIAMSPRRVLLTACLAMTAAGSTVAANAADPSDSTGSCAKKFNVSTPTTISCGFQVSAASHTFGGGGSARPADGSAVAAWTFTMSAAGQPQPLNSCGGVGFSGCGTVTWTSDAVPRGGVIECTVRAVGVGQFSCEAARG
jgi:hypothetical protein